MSKVQSFNVPTELHIKRRRRLREQISGKGTSDTRWVRHIYRRVVQGDVDGAEALWQSHRMVKADLEDLRKASKIIMTGYNNAGRWLDTIRLFKWNEDAIRLDRRGKRRGGDIIKRQNVGRYLAELDTRSKRQREIVTRCIALSGEKGQGLPAETEDTTLDQMGRESVDLNLGSQINDERAFLLQLGRLPHKFLKSRDSIKDSELKAFVNNVPVLESSTNAEPSQGEVGVDSELLDLCFKALLGRSNSESIITLFYQYQPWISFTEYTWESVLAAFINLGKIKKAQGLIRYAVYRRIRLSHACYIMVLSAVKKKGGSWDKMVRYFKWLENITASTVPGIYHIMIQTAVERDMKIEANAYLNRMRDRGLSHKASTCAALLTAQAKINDWTSLQKTLDIVDGQGLDIQIDPFNMVLNAYAEAKGYSDTLAFFDYGIRRGIVPDHRTYNIMMKAAVSARRVGSENLLPYWLREMVASGIKPNDYTFNMLFQDLRRNHGASVAVLRRVYQKLLRMETTVRVLDFCSKDMLLKSQHYETVLYPATYKQIKAKDFDRTGTKETAALLMASAIEVGKHDEALNIWRDAVEGKREPSFQMTILALRACILSKERSHLMPGVLRVASKHGLDLPRTLISMVRDSCRTIGEQDMDNLENINQLFTGFDEAMSLKYDKIYAKLGEIYNFLEKNALPITHHVAVHSANRFINAGRPHAAIQLLNQVAMTKWGRKTTFDIVAYSVIMKAYCRARDLNGIKWTADTVIALRLKPESPLYSVLQSLIREYEIEKDGNQVVFVETIANRLKLHRANLMVQAKEKGDLIVDFIKGSVGLRVKRRYGVNWPLVTRERTTPTIERRRTYDRNWLLGEPRKAEVGMNKQLTMTL